jgi:hypothetical protein
MWFVVMAGLVPAIHVLQLKESKNVDARHKAGHDEQHLSKSQRVSFPP